MKRVNILLVGFLLAAFLGAGCGGCRSTIAPLVPTNDETKSPYIVAPHKIWDYAQTFLYEHAISFTQSEPQKQAINVESVNIIGAHGLMSLKKKIDDAHFFELVKEGPRYAVKNRVGPFHAGTDNRLMYDEILYDSFNALDWVLGQFALKEHLTRHSSSDDKKTVFLIDMPKVPAKAPFLTYFASLAPSFKLFSSKVEGRLEVDAKRNIPTYARFTIELTSVDSRSIKVEAQTKLSLNEPVKDLTFPELSEEKAPLYPVNIAPRFNDMFKNE